MKKVKKKVYKRRIKACASAPKEKPVTLTDIVRVAHALNMDVQVGLTPNPPPRPLLNLTPSQWPGDPSCRSIIADMQCSEKTIERVFRDNPSSKWVITPYEIVERTQFFAPKPAPTPEASKNPNPNHT